MPTPPGLIRLITLGLFILVAGCEKPAPENLDQETKDSQAPKKESVQNEDSGKKSGDAENVKPEPRLLITAEELINGLSESSSTIIDVRSSKDYQKEHLPGAIHIDLAMWKKKSLEKEGLNDSKFWAETIGNLGIASGTEVVVYSNLPPNAARASWLLGFQGLKNVLILDGGWKKWQEVSGPTTDQVPNVKSAKFKPAAQTDWVISTSEVLDTLEKVTVADSRSVAEYEGTGGKGKRKGHIPGAIRMEWSDLLNEDDTYKSKKDLQDLLKEKGFKPDQSVITHCQTGGRASVNFIAFRLAGYPGIKNYYCGWSEWSAEDSHPIDKSESKPKKSAN